MLCWSLRIAPWFRFYSVTVGITLVTKVYRSLLLTSSGKETVVPICWLIWVTRHKARSGFPCCLRVFTLTSSWTGVVSLALGSRRLSFFLLLCFFRLFLVCFEGFGLVPPSFFSPFFNKFFYLSLTAWDGGSTGCQPSWDVVASP